jgi:hypothetical protein
MSDFDQTRKMAAQGTEAFNENLKKGTAAVERSMQDAEKKLSTSVDAMRHYNLKMIELARTNSEALFDFAQKMTMARSPTDMAELWKAYCEKQVEMLNRQMAEMTSTAQSMFSNAVRK